MVGHNMDVLSSVILNSGAGAVRSSAFLRVVCCEGSKGKSRMPYLSCPNYYGFAVLRLF